jgi:hypothetical protein
VYTIESHPNVRNDAVGERKQIVSNEYKEEEEEEEDNVRDGTEHKSEWRCISCSPFVYECSTPLCPIFGYNKHNVVNCCGIFVCNHKRTRDIGSHINVGETIWACCIPIYCEIDNATYVHRYETCECDIICLSGLMCCTVRKNGWECEHIACLTTYKNANCSMYGICGVPCIPRCRYPVNQVMR